LTSRKKATLFFEIFTIGVVVYVCLLNFPACCELFKGLDIFPHNWGNFIFITLVLGAVAYALTELIDAGAQALRRIGSRKPKVGRILVAKGLITPAELKAALREQEFRLGEVLVQARRITPQQKHEALGVQREKGRRIGNILKDLGYASEADIRWALHRMNRRLGEILREKGLLTDYELVRALSLKNCRVDDRGRVFVLK